MSTCSRVRVVENSQRGEARRQAVERAVRLGFGEERSGRVAVVVAELAGNLVKHVPRGGDLFVATIDRNGATAVEIVAVDSGPGIADKERALEDGYSTAGSVGNGLGAVARLSDSFDLYSTEGKGTVVVSRIWRDGGRDASAVSAGGVCGMMEGETVSGDDFGIMDVDGRTRIVVADGLGHGHGAREAAAEAIEAFRGGAAEPVGQVLESIHRRLRPTRGAAVALAEIDPGRRTLCYTGLGNIAGTIVGGDAARSLVSHNGTAGHAVRRIQEFTHELPPAAVVVLHSDGITSRWNLDAYAGLSRRAPTVTAGVLYRDFHRGRDDATAVVAHVP
jgi:anti-sigma regulatory factor (Ser/Thr protein kinase)